MWNNSCASQDCVAAQPHTKQAGGVQRTGRKRTPFIIREIREIRGPKPLDAPLAESRKGRHLTTDFTDGTDEESCKSLFYLERFGRDRTQQGTQVVSLHSMSSFAAFIRVHQCSSGEPPFEALPRWEIRGSYTGLQVQARSVWPIR
jgi:hypothetical protein